MPDSELDRLVLNDEFILQVINDFPELSSTLLKFIQENYKFQPYSFLNDDRLDIKLSDALEQLDIPYMEMDGRIILNNSDYTDIEDDISFLCKLFNYEKRIKERKTILTKNEKKNQAV